MFKNVKNCGAGKFVSTGEWIHPDRTINSYELILVVKGTLYICENSVQYQLSKGEVLILHPNLRHYGYKTSTDTEFFWMHWHNGPEISADMKHRKVEDTYHIIVYLLQLLRSRTLQNPQEILDYLTRLVLFEFYATSRQTKTNHIAEKTYALIVANRHRKITKEQISDMLGYNVDYLNRIFKSTFSKTIKQSIDEKRMEYIKHLMLPWS